MSSINIEHNVGSDGTSNRPLIVVVAVLAIALVYFSMILSTNVLDLAEAAVVRIKPPAQTVNIGDTISLNVEVDNAKDVYAWEMSLVYDPEILVLAGVNQGSFFTKDRRDVQTFFVPPNVQKRGQINSMAHTKLGQDKGVSGSGVLSSVEFVVLKGGDASVSIDGVILVDSKNSQILAKPEHALITAIQ